MLAPDLHTARLVSRFVENGRPYLASLLRPATVPLYQDISDVLAALWDRGDKRPTADRLDSAGLAGRASSIAEGLARDGLLLPDSVDEPAEWTARLESQVAPVPHVDQVELTNACPFTCGFCPRGLGRMHRPIGHLDLGLLRDIVEQVKHLTPFKPFGLHHFGDPILHPRVAEAVRIVRDAGLEPELSVNPVLLDERLASAILDAGVGVLIVSIDGLDEETLVAMRGRAAAPFDRVERNVNRLLELASAMERPPTVMMSMVATRRNRHQWEQLFEIFTHPGWPWLVPVVRLLEDFGDPSIEPLGVVRLRQLCGAPWRIVSILWDGTVVPCCHDFEGALPLGNLREQRLDQIWAGEPVRRLRERWKARDFASHEPCHHCRWRPDLFAAEPEVADTDAWTPRLWMPPFPPR